MTTSRDGRVVAAVPVMMDADDLRTHAAGAVGRLMVTR